VICCCSLSVKDVLKVVSVLNMFFPPFICVIINIIIWISQRSLRSTENRSCGNACAGSNYQNSTSFPAANKRMESILGTDQPNFQNSSPVSTAESGPSDDRIQRIFWDFRKQKGIFRVIFRLVYFFYFFWGELIIVLLIAGGLKHVKLSICSKKQSCARDGTSSKIRCWIFRRNISFRYRLA